jgi:hypothetical protein
MNDLVRSEIVFDTINGSGRNQQQAFLFFVPLVNRNHQPSVYEFFRRKNDLFSRSDLTHFVNFHLPHIFDGFYNNETFLF